MAERISLFLCGDVMLGRGIDQVLPHPCDPTLHERSVRSAERYVELAEKANGPIPRPVEFDYEGIAGREQYRDDLGLMYFPEFELESGRLTALNLVPTRLKNFQVQRPDEKDYSWLLDTLKRECESLGTKVERTGRDEFSLRW